MQPTRREIAANNPQVFVMQAPASKRSWIKYGSRQKSRSVLRRPLRQHWCKIERAIFVRQHKFAVRNCDRSLPPEDESCPDPLYGLQRTRLVQGIALRTIKVRFANARH